VTSVSRGAILMILCAAQPLYEYGQPMLARADTLSECQKVAARSAEPSHSLGWRSLNQCVCSLPST
jgi:hypothetical protein